MIMSISLKSYLARFFKGRFNLFLQQRIPANQQQTLNNKKIFILPSKFGVCYLFFILLLFLLGTNYQNNLVMLVCYLLISFFITSMLHSFYNLSGLQLTAITTAKGYANQTILLKIKLTSAKERFDLNFCFANQSISHYDIITQGENTVSVGYWVARRGVHQLGRIKVFSRYGFGLFTTWSQLDLASQIIAYPEPLSFQYSGVSAALVDDNEPDVNSYRAQQVLAEPINGDDFEQLIPYQQGQPYTHVAWKQLAKGQGWYTKQHQKNAQPDIVLILSNMPANTLENKISQLCFLILEYHQSGSDYRVAIDQISLGPSSGEQFLHECLMALVQYPQKGSY